MCSKGEEYVTPESFGAVGDGKHNDAVAFNQCIKSGKTIKLKLGRTYKLETPIHTIEHDVFKLEGNGASIIISKDFPVSAAMAIFVFSMDVAQPKLMEVNNVSFQCLLEEKKVANAGDTYLFLSKKCDKVIFKNVKFKSEKKYNNVTFFRSEGGDLLMDGCDIVLNTYSRIGGIFWLMNKSHTKNKIEIRNSSFEYETKDECMCFSTASDSKLKNSNIDVVVENCKFKSLATMESSGFMIVYSRCLNTLSNINVTYNKCVFESNGVYPRYIQTYQSGGEAYDFGSFNTSFNNCTFNFSKTNVDDYSEGGLVGLVYNNSNQIKRENVGYRFNDCTFNLSNIYPIVGDKDASRKGYFKFSNCNVNSNARTFQKKYNVKTCDISLELNRCKVRSADEEFSYKEMDVKSCSFINREGKSRSLNRVKGNDWDKVIIGR